MRRLIKLSGFLLAVIIVQHICSFTKFRANLPVLVADQGKITKPQDITLEDGRNMKVIYVPVTIYNLGLEPVKFWAMDCLQDKFFGTDLEYLKVPQPVCWGHDRGLITLKPDSGYKTRVKLIYRNGEIAEHAKFKIYMKVPDESQGQPLMADSTMKLIYSNEITVP